MSTQPHHYPYLPPPTGLPSSQAGPSRSRSTSTFVSDTYLPPPSSIYTPNHQTDTRTPFPPSSSSTSSSFAFRPPYLPTPRPRSSTSTSPIKAPHEHENQVGKGGSSDDGEGEGEQQKLAIKREKNRIKQQKLRLRRANHISDLETSLEKAQNDYTDLQTRYEAALKKEQGLQRYIYSLEGVLRRYGLQGELEALNGGQTAERRVKREGDEGMDNDMRKRRKTGNMDSSGYGGQSGFSVHASHIQYTAPLPSHQAHYQPLSLAEATPDHPRTSTSSFPPLHLSQAPEALSASSPRSIRIEDLLSPSLGTSDTFQPFPGCTMPVPDSTWTGGYQSTGQNPVEGEMQQGGQVVLSPRPGLGGVAMRHGESSESLGGKSSAAVSAVEGYLDGTYPPPRTLGLAGMTALPVPPITTPLTLPPPYSASSPSTIAQPTLHPSVHSARVLLRAMLAVHPTSTLHYTLPPLTPDHQKILLNAIYNLTTPSFRDLVNDAQIRNMPPLLMKSLMSYSHSSTADLRVVLMPIAILRARIVGFLAENLPFDVTAFISHVLADATVFGDTADPDSWEMSDEFWDVWGGWFKAGRSYCKSLAGWRRRYGHKGAGVVEILLGKEGEMSRMKEELIGRPEGWKRSEVLPPDKEMLVGKLE